MILAVFIFQPCMLDCDLKDNNGLVMLVDFQ